MLFLCNPSKSDELSALKARFRKQHFYKIDINYVISTYVKESQIKQNLTLYVDKNLVKEAKEMGINLSGFSGRSLL